MIISENSAMGLSMTELSKLEKNNPEKNSNINQQTNVNPNINNDKLSQISKKEKISLDNNNNPKDNSYTISLNQNLRNENSIKLKESMNTIKDVSVVEKKLNENNEIMRAFLDTKEINSTKINELENKLGKINNKISTAEESLIDKYNKNNSDISNIITNNTDFSKNNIFVDNQKQSFLNDYQNFSKNPNLLEEPVEALNNMKNKAIEETKINLKSQKEIVDKNLNNFNDYTKFQMPLIQTGHLAYSQSNTNQLAVFNLLK